MAYTVQKLAALSGVSVRTLHHYDEIGLLKPAYYGENGYRYYEEEQMLLLQQILFFRKLGFELKKIRELLKKGDFDKLAALLSHRKLLIKQLGDTRALIETIDNTIKHLQGKKKMKAEQFFEGLNSPKQKEYEKYLIERGKCSAEEIERSRKRLENWTKGDWHKMQENWELIMRGYVEAIKNHTRPDAPESLELVQRHLDHLKQFFGMVIEKKDLFESAKAQFEHPDWQKTFANYHPQLLEFMLESIEAYAKRI